MHAGVAELMSDVSQIRKWEQESPAGGAVEMSPACLSPPAEKKTTNMGIPCMIRWEGVQQACMIPLPSPPLPQHSW